MHADIEGEQAHLMVSFYVLAPSYAIQPFDQGKQGVEKRLYGLFMDLLCILLSRYMAASAMRGVGVYDFAGVYAFEGCVVLRRKGL